MHSIFNAALVDTSVIVDTGQIVVKTVLIAVLVIVALLIIVPGRGARGSAIQKLALLVAIVAGILSVVFPNVTTHVANFLGIGRGVDLLLYALVVLFIAYALRTTIRIRRMDRNITVLARKIALLEANVREGRDTFADTGMIDLSGVRPEQSRGTAGGAGGQASERPADEGDGSASRA